MAKHSSESTHNSVELAERIRQVIGRFVRLTRAHANTPKSAQSDSLDLLAREGALTVAELAETRKVRHQTMRVTIGQLEAEGLVRREVNPDDARSQLIALTRQGRSAVTKGRKDRARWIDKVLRKEFTGEEVKCLITSLDAMERLMERYPIDYEA